MRPGTFCKYGLARLEFRQAPPPWERLDYGAAAAVHIVDNGVSQDIRGKSGMRRYAKNLPEG